MTVYIELSILILKIKGDLVFITGTNVLFYCGA